MTDEISRFNVESIEGPISEFQAEVDDLNHLVSEYLRCIKERDRESFLDLFYLKAPCLGKFDSESEQIAWTNNPDVVNDLGVFDISKDAFVNSMVTPPQGLEFEEKISNLKIDTDGLIASINFDYQMLVNENKIKSGREFWQLIKTNEGWKIVSVIHSIKF